MVHLPPLPGSPRHRPERGRNGARWVEHAVRDAALLAAAGFDGVLVENLGDAPYYADDVPDVTVAAMAVAAQAVRAVLPRGMLLGINVLRNDALAALAIAAAADADLVRINVLGGAMLTDQGLIQGRAAEVARERKHLAPQVRVLADVRVKHAAPLAERPLHDEVADLVERCGADALVVSGPRTGEPVDLVRLAAVAAAAAGRPVLIGSGATAATVGDLLAHADGVIVGTHLKRRHRIDAERARAFVDAARARSRPAD
jgi:membrane complex biogenesis BtpA family protein